MERGIEGEGREGVGGWRGRECNDLGEGRRVCKRQRDSEMVCFARSECEKDCAPAATKCTVLLCLCALAYSIPLNEVLHRFCHISWTNAPMCTHTHTLCVI